MIRRPPRSTHCISSAASDVYKRQSIDSPTKCTKGHYCPAGSQERVPCPVGTYCPEEGHKTPPLCPAGFYCPNQPSGAGNSDLKPCHSDQYCEAGLSDNNNALCPQGYYCPQSFIKKPCNVTAGYFCRAGQTKEKDAKTPCPKGFSCPGGSAPPIRCLLADIPAGYYQSEQQDSCNQTQCMEGYYCLGGSNEPLICPQGKYCVAGLSLIHI